MIKYIILAIIFTLNVMAIEVKIVAVVNNKPITSWDVKNRTDLTFLLNQNLAKNQRDAVMQSALQELVREKLLFAKALESNFVIPNKDAEDEINAYFSSNPSLKGKKPQTYLSKAMYDSLVMQIKGDIILNAITQGSVQGKLVFSAAEVSNFRQNYKTETGKNITEAEAKNMLTSLKINEVQQSIIRSLYNDAIIEEK